MEGQCGDHGVVADEKVGMSECTWTALVMRKSVVGMDGDQQKDCVSLPWSFASA